MSTDNPTFTPSEAAHASYPPAARYLDSAALLELFENSADGFAIVDAVDGRYLHLNRAACEALGVERDELIATRAPWPNGDGTGQEQITHFGGRVFSYQVTELKSDGRGVLAIRFRDITAEQRREERVRAFALSAAHIAFAESLSVALDRLAERVRRIANMASCTFLLYDDDGRVRMSGAAGRYPHSRDYMQRLVESRDRGAPLISDRVMETRRPEIVIGWHTRMLTDPSFAPMLSFTEKADWDTIVVVPLLVRGEPVGVLNGFYRVGTQPEDDDLPFLVSIADQAAIAVDMFALRDRATSDAAREERARIARDLHDSVSQMLFTLNLQAAAAESAAAGLPVEKPLHEIRSLSSDAFVAMRQLILGTRPLAVDDGSDLLTALRQHVVALAEHTDIEVDLVDPGELPSVPIEIQEQLFRVVQESLTNAIRHAPGCRVRVAIERDPDRPLLTVEIADDGAGFDPVDPHPGHFGLTGMDERIRRIGGRLTIRSGRSGTTVRAVVPLERGGQEREDDRAD